MRSMLRAVLLLSLAACATREHPYRFSSPLLGTADVPPPSFAKTTKKKAAPAQVANRSAPLRRAGGWQADAQEGTIRVVSARGIELRKPVASAEEAAAITDEPNAQPSAWSRLPAPNKTPSAVDLVTAIPPPPKEPSQLRSLVGVRDKRDPFEVVATWTAELGLHIEGTNGPALVDWAANANKLAARDALPDPGDVLVFDHTVSANESDLVAIVIARDARGVTEFMYAGGGVIRRGFLDVSRPTIRRDEDGLVVNTFLRHGKLWPPKGTRYLSGELLSHVIRSH